MTMDKMRVSRHGERRARQRVGLPKKSVERNAQRALTDGIGYREASGALRRYISWLLNCMTATGTISGYMATMCGFSMIRY